MSDDDRDDEARAFQDLLLDYTEDAIMVFDVDWRLRVWNKGAERRYGWSADEVLGRPVPNFMPMDLGPQERVALREVIVEHGRWRGEVTLQGKDGSTVRVEIVSGPVRDAAGEILGYVSIHRDLGEREAAE